MKNILIVQNNILHYRKPLYNELANSYSVTVLHSGSKSLEEADIYEEIITPKIKIGKIYIQKGVLKEIRSRKYDVVIVMFDIAWIMNNIGMLIKGRAKYLFWGHRYNNNKIANTIRNLLMKKSDGIILYGEKDIPKMEAKGIDREKVFVAHNTMFIGNTEDGSLFEGKVSLLFVGRAQKRKRVDLLLQSFSSILSQIPENITIDIIGEGKENEYLMNLAENLGIADRVVFHGAITDENLLKPFFLRSIAYVSPGAVGLSVLQCFAYGLPVITYNNCYHGPEFDNIIHMRNSIVYNNEAELDDVLIYYCNHLNEARELGHNAFLHYSDKRNLNTMISGFVQAINC